MWKPCFTCPECRSALLVGDDGYSYRCDHCHLDYLRENGVFRFLTSDRAEAANAFARQYRAVRERDGYRNPSGDYYRMLPLVPSDDPCAPEWRIRRESFATFQHSALPRLPIDAPRILDLGAGNGWLSHRLAGVGVRPVAVDRMDDEVDGLGACRHYRVAFTSVQADFNALPFAGQSFDAVVFNASLHYSSDLARTLAEAQRVLAPRGLLVVMDSPMFDRDEHGERMLVEQRERFHDEYGIAEPVAAGIGYLTHERLTFALKSLGMRPEFVPSRGPGGWRLRRRLSALRLGRQPAGFGVVVAQ